VSCQCKCPTAYRNTYLEKPSKYFIIPHFLNDFERVIKVIDVLNVNFEEFGLKT